MQSVTKKTPEKTHVSADTASYKGDHEVSSTEQQQSEH